MLRRSLGVLARSVPRVGTGGGLGGGGGRRALCFALVGAGGLAVRQRRLPVQCAPLAEGSCAAAAAPDLALALSPPRSLAEAVMDAIWRWLWGVVEGVRIVHRAGRLALIFTPTILTSPLLLLHPDSPSLVWWWSLLRDSIRRSGPCNIKFSQWIATRPDLFPLVLCQQLQDLQTNAIRCSWSLTQKTLSDMFGPLWRDIFALEVDPATGEPLVIGSGCVAQVLKGQLLQPSEWAGAPVAVKVIHPTVAKAIEDDIRIMRWVASWVEAVPRLAGLGLSESVEEFAAFMNSQLDLRKEAASLVRFRKNFASGAETAKIGSGSNRESNTVHFPEPLYPHVTRLVLVESFVAGELMLDLMHRLDAPARHRLATMGLDAILKMVFQDNFIHADMHMGNIICAGAVPCSAGAQPTPLKMTMIDAGLVAELEPQDRRNFIDLFKAVVLNDGRKVGRLIIERSRNYGQCHDPEGFEVELENVVRTVHASGLALGRIGIGALLQRVLVACYRHNVKLESKFVSVVLAIGVVEGLGRRLDPDVDILRKAAPYVLRASLANAQGANSRSS